MNHPLLIDTDTLQKTLGKPELLVIDVRGDAAYEYGGHIPGAVHTTWHQYSDPNAVAKGLLDPDMNRMEQKMRALGLNKDSEVVIYSNPFDNWGDEGRMYWMLEYFGHTNMRILDGGWVKWVAEQRPFEHGRVTPNPAISRSNRSATRSSPKTNCGRWSSILSPARRFSTPEAWKNIWERKSRAFHGRDIFPPLFTWHGTDFEYQRDGQGSRNHQGRSGRQRTGAG